MEKRISFIALYDLLLLYWQAAVLRKVNKNLNLIEFTKNVESIPFSGLVMTLHLL